MGLNDEEAALVAGITEVTFRAWRRDKVFVEKIKRAVALRLYKRLQKIESGADGWQGTGWVLERLYPTRFAKPEIQLSFNNNTLTQNFLSISISGSEAKEIESVAEPVRESVRAMFERYKPAQIGNGNVEPEKPVVPVEAEVIEAPIARREGDEQKPTFWAQFTGDRDRLVEHRTAEFVARTIVSEVLGPRRCGKVEFDAGEITVEDVLARIERAVGVGSAAGWQRVQKKAGQA